MENIMKRPGPELGDLASRFFAYIQLKNKDIIRTGELSPVVGISAPQERDLLRRLSSSGWIVRLKRGVYLVPLRIPAGGKYSPGIARILEKLMEEQHSGYQICGPTAFNFYGFVDQKPNVTYVYNSSISGSRTIGNLSFQFIKTSKARLGSVNQVSVREGNEIIYSSRPRTLMDAVYDWSRFNSLPQAYGWIRQELAKNPDIVSELVKAVLRYGNLATVRRIGYLLDALIQPSKYTKQLQRPLSDARALIPWIPGKPARGRADRKWGVIVNE
jgi:predicted transcriptional regulator of viral defense system